MVGYKLFFLITAAKNRDKRKWSRFFALLRLCFFATLFVVCASLPVMAFSVSRYCDIPKVPEDKIVSDNDPVTQWVVLWREARILARRGEHEAALEKYAQLLEDKPFLTRARWEQATIYLSLGQFDRATALLEILLSSSPETMPYLNALGYALGQKGHFDRAIELFGRSLVNVPDNLPALDGISLALLSLDRDEEALPYLEKLYLLDPSNRTVRQKLAEVYEKFGEDEKARPLTVQLVEDEEFSVEDVVLAARVHAQLGLGNLALVYWQQVLTMSPANVRAHDWLASYYEKKGHTGQALQHLLFLLEQGEKNPGLLIRTGACYMRLNQPSMALPYYEKFLHHNTQDKEALRQLVNIHAALGRGKETLIALDHYFQVESDPPAGNLRQAAKLYDAAGRYHDAIPIYRRLLELNPDDPDVLETLARDLISIGEDEGALTVWARLAEISEDSKEIYFSMIELLERLGRHEELISLLNKLHRLDPADTRISLMLVSALLTMEEVVKGEFFFQAVAESEIFSVDLLAMRAEIFEFFEMYEHALKDYEEILRLGSTEPALCLKCMELAGFLGKSDTVRFYFDNVPPPLNGENQLIAANAFRDGGEYPMARSLYKEILDQPSAGKNLRSLVFLNSAELFRQQHLFYEAEQALRQALLENTDRSPVLARLVDLQLEKGDLAASSDWLEQLQHEEQSVFGKMGENDSVLQVDLQRRLFVLKHLNHAGKFADAISLGKDLLAEMVVLEEERVDCSGSLKRDPVLFELGRAYLGLEDFVGAEKQCMILLARKSFDLPLLALLEKIYAAQGDREKLDKAVKQSMAVAGKDPYRMMLLARIYQQDSDIDAMKRAAFTAKNMAPDSFTTSLLYVRALSESGDLVRARDLLNELEVKFPGNEALASLAARITFRMGLYQEALGHCETVLAVHPDRSDLIFLQGRIYWKKIEWRKSLDIYQGYLETPVSVLLTEGLHKAGLERPPQRKATLVERITFAKPLDDQFVDQLMKPDFAASVEMGKINKVSAPFYARFKWQQQFSDELEARRAAKQKDYFRASNLFSQLIDTSPQDASLIFDLAGIYSGMGKLGEESALYEKLSLLDPHFYGLVEARERNRIKRKPRSDLAYSYVREERENGTKAIKKNSVDLDSWVSLGPGHGADITLSRIRYGSTETDDSLMSSRFFAFYEATNILNRLGLRLGGGVESLAEGEGDVGLVHCSVNGKLGDRVQGEIHYSRDLVRDTPASITRKIVAEKTSTNFYLGLLPKLLTGGGYEFTSYSDGNEMKGYSLWASYIFMTEPTYLRFRFNHEFKDTDSSGAGKGALLEDGFWSDAHPYWSPTNYWKNSFGIMWKHTLSADILERGKPTYYSTEYLMEFESDGNLIHTFKASFVVELTDDFMLESVVEFMTSDDYRANDVSLSAVYRW